MPCMQSADNDCVHAGYLLYLKSRLSPRVYDQYASALRRLACCMTSSDLDSYFLGRLSSVTGKTLNNELCILKGFLRWLESRGQNGFDRSILSYTRLRHVPKKFRRALTSEEISRLRTVSGVRWAWWSFLLHTGLRKSEFENLACTDVLDGAIQVRDAKNPLKQRLVPLHSEAMGLLCFARNDIGGPLFRLPKHLLRVFKKDLACAGISQEIDLHCLRVTFVSALARAGVSPRTAQELAGHSDIRTTLKIYTKVTDRDKVDAVNRLVF